MRAKPKLSQVVVLLNSGELCRIARIHEDGRLDVVGVEDGDFIALGLLPARVAYFNAFPSNGVSYSEHRRQR